MFRCKKDVDKHVENLTSKLSAKEFQSRAQSIARLYYEVEDYASCQRYAELYLTHKNNSAAACKLLGQALQKLGQKEKALEQYKVSLDIDPTQSSLILDICEILADTEVTVEPGRAKYWCEKAEAIFPKHPITFNLREKLMTMTNSDPEAIIHLLKSELAVRPKDVTLHARLLKHYLQSNKYMEAFEHSFEHEFDDNYFTNNYAWYETLGQILKYYTDKTDWRYQLLLLTVKERLCALSLTEVPSCTAKGLVESNNLLHDYDQALNSIAISGPSPGCADFHNGLLNHHRGQFVFHLATFLLRKAKKNLLSWREAISMAASLMLISWQTVPLHTHVNWLTHAPVKQRLAVNRWYLEGSYRCSQSGYFLSSNFQDKSHSFIDQITQSCSDPIWRDKLYEEIFNNYLSKKSHSDFVCHSCNLMFKLPRKSEVQAYDVDAQRLYPNSLHHFVWMILNYSNYDNFKCSVFDMLTPKTQNFANCGPESLSKYDMFSFLLCTALTSKQSKQSTAYASDKPQVLPSNVTDLLCTPPQLKWWDCAYKLSQNELGTELTDIRSTLSRGIEVVRCIDSHGLDPEILCILGRIFKEKANSSVVFEEKSHLEMRAKLYYSNAIPLLERLKSKMSLKFPQKRMFEYIPKDLSPKEIMTLIEESKLFVSVCYLNESHYEKAVEVLSTIKSGQGLFHLSQVYKKMALDISNTCKERMSFDEKKKCLSLLKKAKSCANAALETIKQDQDDTQNELYSDILELIEYIEINISRYDSDMLNAKSNDIDGKHSSDENIFLAASNLRDSNSHVFRNLNSTPKRSNANSTIYRSAAESEIYDNPKIDLELLGAMDLTVRNFMDQVKTWIDENRNLGNQIMSCVNANIQNTNEQLKLLKLSMDQIKEQISKCQDEYKDVGELKKQLTELKKEMTKLKKTPPERVINDENEYLEDNYKLNSDPASAFGGQLPFPPPTPLLSSFNPRLMPSFPIPPALYGLYGQNFYNYSQYPQFSQTNSVPGTSQICDPARPPINYPGVYRPPEEIYPDMTPLIPPSVTPAVSVSGMTTVVPAGKSVSVPVSKTAPVIPVKEKQRSPPVNVVITSSDPLPTCTTAPHPILSVTIPPEHIKGTPHNYQIPMPSISESQIKPPIFSTVPKTASDTASIGRTLTWNQSTDSNSSEYPCKTPTASSVIETAKFPLFHSPKTGGMFNNFTPDKSIINLDTSHNKSRTLSEKSNTSLDNYDPCPDFKPIVPLPDEVKVTTGEEDETAVFSARAKLFRFVDKQWKERGIGEMKLLKHNLTGKVRVLMRREQVHKICANHIVTSEMEIQPMKNENKAYFWVANDFADEKVVLEKFCIRFKTVDIANQFYQAFVDAIKNANSSSDDGGPLNEIHIKTVIIDNKRNSNNQLNKTVVGGFTFSTTPTFKLASDEEKKDNKLQETKVTAANPFSNLSFKTSNSPLSNMLISDQPQLTSSSPITSPEVQFKLNKSDVVDEFEPTTEFKPVVPLPALVDHKTGEENEIVLFENRAKLLRFDATMKEWKERGLGNIKLLVHKDNIQKARLLMRREQVMKVCCNHALTPEISFQKMPNLDKAVTWCAKDFSEGELISETFCLRFKTVQQCDDFINAVKSAQSKMICDSKAVKEVQAASKHNSDNFKPKLGSWYCHTCKTNNLESFVNCACCETPKPFDDKQKIAPTVAKVVTPFWGDKFKPKTGSWECNTCLIINESNVDNCSACNTPKDPSETKNDSKSIFGNSVPKFSFGIPPQAQGIGGHKNDVALSSVWGDKFKPKSGTWECKQCFVRNDSNIVKCNACGGFKDPSLEKKEPPSKNDTPISSVWGDKFKPKTGTWECKQCFVRNESNIVKCNACGGFKDPSLEKKEQPSKNDIHIPISSFWGDKFKPKSGTWECKDCFVRNESNIIKCNACGGFKDPSLEKKEQPSLFGNLSPAPQFVFGLSKPNEVSQEKPQNESSSIFDGSGTHKFIFGNSTNFVDLSAKSGLNFKFGSDVKTSEKNDSSFNVTPTTKSTDSVPLNFYKKNEESKIPVADKPALLPTPQNEDEASSTSFVPKDHSSFDFVFKSKSPNATALMKSPKTDESTENDYGSEDEGHVHFSPVVPMPDKVEVFTGEENELELYAQRAKLFRFVAGEWKERGIGTVKILKHKGTGKLRIVMRREQVLKICLNHALTHETNYVAKDEKTWLFAANDFSEGELSLQQFCLRFQSKAIAEEFKNATTKALEGLKTPLNKKDSEDVVFVSETQATPQEKQRAKELMLPENFFIYQNKHQCPGCRGCTDDDNSESSGQLCNTPAKKDIKESPSSSIYETPMTLNKSADSTMFHTPLGAVGESTQKFKTNNRLIESSNFENTFTSKDVSVDKSSVSQNSSLNSTLSNSITQTPTGTKSSILAAPKLNTCNNSNENGTNAKSTSSLSSGAAEGKSVFSTDGVTNKSIFSTPVGSEKLDFGSSKTLHKNEGLKENKNEISSKFSSSGSVNIFTGTGQGNIFVGTDNSKAVPAFTNLSGSIFSSDPLDDNKTLTNEGSIFTTGTKAWPFNNMTKTGNESDENKIVHKKEISNQQYNDQTLKNVLITDKKEDNIFQTDKILSFADLSVTGPGFGQKQYDFKWEGAGQQIFGITPKSSTKKEADKDNNGDAEVNTSAEKENEEYDPHYEPIVPLPDVIVVTTGEEDEEKLFCQRCKLYRYDEKTREWKERGVGEMKILYHPARKSYRLLLRREMIHKPVLNMLISTDFELLPMKNSDRAWTWAGRNFAESPSGDQETLAVRFKSTALADSFKDKVTECVRTLQANAAQAIRDMEAVKDNSTASLRLPKHMPQSSRVDDNIAASVTRSIDTPVVFESTTKAGQPSAQTSSSQGVEETDSTTGVNTVMLRLPKHLSDSARVDASLAEVNLAESSQMLQRARESKSSRQVVQDGSRLQVHFHEPAVVEEGEAEEVGDDDEEYDHNYDDYDEQQESTPFFMYEGEAHIQQNDTEITCDQAQIQLFYCQNDYSPKIMVVDPSTGEILADMVFDNYTDFKDVLQLDGPVVSWAGTECAGGEPLDKVVTVTFADADTATHFYSNCEEFM